MSQRFQGGNRGHGVSSSDLDFGQRQNGIGILGIQGQGLVQIGNGLVGVIVGKIGQGQLVIDHRHFGERPGQSLEISYGLGGLALLQFQPAFQKHTLEILRVAAQNVAEQGDAVGILFIGGG